MMGGGSDINEKSNKLGLPSELLKLSEEFKHDNNGIYPDNLLTVLVFKDIMTQWRVGPGGPYALDYNVLREVWITRRIKVVDRAEVFDGLQIMESAALGEIKREQ